jgi:putative transposase
MRNVRRYNVSGHPVFLTQVCAGRHPALATADRKMLLLSELHGARTRLGIRVYAWVVLDDHFHLLIDTAGERMSKLMYSVKRRVSEQLLHTAGVRGIWQPRFYDHIIRDETDWRAHLDYLHYNPVNHGYVPTA